MTTYYPATHRCVFHSCPTPSDCPLVQSTDGITTPLRDTNIPPTTLDTQANPWQLTFNPPMGGSQVVMWTAQNAPNAVMNPREKPIYCQLSPGGFQINDGLDFQATSCKTCKCKSKRIKSFNRSTLPTLSHVCHSVVRRIVRF